MHIQIFTAADILANLDQLSALLVDTVQNNGAVGFVVPITLADANRFWGNTILEQVERENRIMLVAFEGDQLAGTVQLIVSMPANQPHRAEVAKLMVHTRFRKLGIAHKLMAELEKMAMLKKRNMITLDTKTGDGAEPLYKSLGYKTAGIIPDYAKDAVGEAFHATTYMYKQI